MRTGLTSAFGNQDDANEVFWVKESPPLPEEVYYNQGLTSGAAVSLWLRRLEGESPARAGKVARWQQEINLSFMG